jgi:hypothetical protein
LRRVAAADLRCRHLGVAYGGRVVHERQLSASGFPGDDGSASAQLREVLRAAGDGTPTSYLTAIAALGEARLLVPVVAQATEVGSGPHDVGSTVGGDVGRDVGGDKEAEMAVVGLQTPDGRRAAVAFTGLDSLGAWHPGARPVPVTIDKVAEAAIADGSVALVVDPAGPASLALETDLLTSFAAGRRLVRLDDGGFGWLTSVPDSG